MDIARARLDHTTQTEEIGPEFPCRLGQGGGDTGPGTIRLATVPGCVRRVDDPAAAAFVVGAQLGGPEQRARCRRVGGPRPGPASGASSAAATSSSAERRHRLVPYPAIGVLVTAVRARQGRVTCWRRLTVAESYNADRTSGWRNVIGVAALIRISAGEFGGVKRIPREAEGAGGNEHGREITGLICRREQQCRLGRVGQGPRCAAGRPIATAA